MNGVAIFENFTKNNQVKEVVDILKTLGGFYGVPTPVF